MERNNTNLQISGKSSIFNIKEGEQNNYQGFYYNYEKNTNELQVKLLDKNITSLEVYNNSRLIYSLNETPLEFTINLNKKYNKKGNLIVMCKDNKGKASVAYVN